MLYLKQLRIRDDTQRAETILPRCRLYSLGDAQPRANQRLPNHSRAVPTVLSEHASFEALGAVDYELLPHLDRHSASFLEKVRLYSESIPHDVVALADGAALIYVDGEPTAAGETAIFSRGVRQDRR